MTIRDRVIELRRVRADELIANPANWRRHPEPQRRALEAALAEIGMAGAVIARQTPEGLELLDGHLRADIDPDAILPVLVVDLDDGESAKLLATFDPIGAMAETDKASLKRLIGELSPSGAGLSDLLERLVHTQSAETDKVDVLPAKVRPRTRKGDLWALGEHRVLCGDATDPENFKRLLGRKRAAVIFTDPPYGVSYEAASGSFAQIAGDNLRRDELAALLIPSLRNALKWSRPAAAFYIWHASSTREDFSFAMARAGLVELQYLIWAKPALTLGWADYQWAHEPCFYACRAGARAEFYGDRTESTVWRVAVPLDGRGGGRWNKHRPRAAGLRWIGNRDLHHLARADRAHPPRATRAGSGAVARGCRFQRHGLGSFARRPVARASDAEAGRTRAARDRELVTSARDRAGSIPRFGNDIDRRGGDWTRVLRHRTRPGVRRHHRRTLGALHRAESSATEMNATRIIR